MDAAAPPDYFMVNCAHPAHILRGLSEPGEWIGRIRGTRVNASVSSHAELDESTELDEGDIPELAQTHEQLLRALPAVTVVGGCCGTDARHVDALWAR